MINTMKRKPYIYQTIVILALLSACSGSSRKVSRAEENLKNKFKIDEVLLDFDDVSFDFNTILIDSSNYELNEIVNILTPSDTKFVNVREVFVEDVLLKLNNYNKDLRSIVLVENVTTGAKISIRYKLFLVGSDTTLLTNYFHNSYGFIKEDEKLIKNKEIFMAIDSTLYIDKANLPNNHKKTLCVTVITNDTIVSQLESKYYPKLLVE